MIKTAAAAATTAAAAWAGYTYLTYDRRWWWARRAADPREVAAAPGWERRLVHGTCAPGWERVRDEFVQNFRARGELGAAVCVFHRGVKVVDLWGGYRDRDAQAPWERDTVCPIYSVSKGVSALALAMLESRGRLSLDDTVATHWPAFAARGKADLTVRDVVDHAAGLAGIDPPLTLDMLADKRAVRDHIAAAAMEWPRGGDRKGYMAIVLGFYESALVQLVEGSGRERTLGEYLREEAFAPLGVDDELFCGTPDSVPRARRAVVDGMRWLEPLWPTGGYPDGFMKKLLLEPNSYTGRAFKTPQLSALPSVMDYNRPEVQRVEMPSANMLGSARAVATVYRAAERAVSTGGRDNPLGLTPQALRSLRQEARPGRENGWVDEILGIEACMGGGVLLPPPPALRGTDGRFCCVPSGFGTNGAGGGMGLCDPEHGLAYAYVMNRCGQLIIDDPRETALRRKVYEAIDGIRRAEGGAPLDLPRLTAAHYCSQRYAQDFPELQPLP